MIIDENGNRVYLDKYIKFDDILEAVKNGDFENKNYRLIDLIVIHFLE